jgi:hypothetical protein
MLGRRAPSGIMVAPSSARFWLALALLSATACSHSRTIAREDTTRDGGGEVTADDGPDGDEPDDDAPGGDDPGGDDPGGTDEAGSEDDEDGDARDAGGDAAAPHNVARCEGSTYTTAPSGAACNVKWLVYNGPTGPSCHAPTVGTHCDSFHLWVAWGEMPTGFDACDDPELGFHSCHYPLGEGGAHAGPLSEAALEAACKATTDFPDTHVVCRVLGP